MIIIFFCLLHCYLAAVQCDPGCMYFKSPFRAFLLKKKLYAESFQWRYIVIHFQFTCSPPSFFSATALFQAKVFMFTGCKHSHWKLALNTFRLFCLLILTGAPKHDGYRVPSPLFFKTFSFSAHDPFQRTKARISQFSHAFTTFSRGLSDRSVISYCIFGSRGRKGARGGGSRLNCLSKPYTKSHSFQEP